MTISGKTLDLITSGFSEMTKLDIVIAPWLTMGNNNERLSPSQKHDLRILALELSLVHGNTKLLWDVTEEISQGYRDRIYYETLLSTAAYLSYMRLGTLVITHEMICVAHSVIKNYVESDGGAILLSLYTRIASYLNLQVVGYFERVPEHVFISGDWHQPWIDYTLDKDLKFGLETGLLVRENDGGQAYVSLTHKGKEVYESCKADLERCGYLKQREQLMRIAQFTNMDDYEHIMERAAPYLHDLRKSLIARSEIRPGMKVLELGCGTGALTLDDGLYKAVGYEGTVIATDPSIGMLTRAKKKQLQYDADNVQFHQGGAEQIPFADNTFDAVIGSLFLHFTDIPKAFEEIHRVTKPGGTFTTIYPLDFSKQEDFFIEWFEPVYKRGLASTSKAVFPKEHTVPEAAARYFDPFTCTPATLVFDTRNVEHVVRFMVQVGTMAELNDLPWQARNILFDELIARGHAVKEKYGEHALKLNQPEQWFHGTVRK
ncbi:class I SAM-dependent methyltransferase [Alicyclobacillus mengziensis]|uniref:Methyltransferase domain-containing protein n=1 Tax=Alicyclobacillus mengziensis TaxID=2931921 RepID=A0A9X7VYM3_9BACL|nr:methyltransferase domain-containing protein [Alicyclobacillus mengziensis]QSO47170.1 methyltransferase domain-containing protein [Alicyclobacillus mengziensis]